MTANYLYSLIFRKIYYLTLLLCVGACSLSLGPVSGALSDRFGCRVVVIAGSLISSVGLVVSHFAGSIAYLCVSFGGLAGMIGCVAHLFNQIPDTRVFFLF